MAEFTPGPWKAIGREVYNSRLELSLAHCFMDGSGYESALANARLMAKSPDMYGALKSLMKKTDCNDYNYLEVYSIDNLLAEIDGEEIPFPDLTEKPPWHKT